MVDVSIGTLDSKGDGIYASKPSVGVGVADDEMNCGLLSAIDGCRICSRVSFLGILLASLSSFTLCFFSFSTTAVLSFFLSFSIFIGFSVFGFSEVVSFSVVVCFSVVVVCFVVSVVGFSVVVVVVVGFLVVVVVVVGFSVVVVVVVVVDDVVVFSVVVVDVVVSLELVVISVVVLTSSLSGASVVLISGKLIKGISS